jgi:hypothetical protein
VEPEWGPPLTKEQVLEQLKNQAKYLEGALDDIKKRIEEIDAGEE